ncbi:MULTISPECIES: hypothetical protein [unclassified Neisseria]|uniref:hypothetical protein n=1 Tax=unclassified Neisseria TaxID=2623750 RepID=UPI001071E60A|nr:MULTISPECIES: hypothetical protein [unclassified Neisseria]MBF0804603.1 hypothetical protein [Neisseria sp. 19428wB4_WF04]TFU40393.1 hypothetical protein E4T99_09660 [Neisseria sp. WF04]
MEILIAGLSDGLRVFLQCPACIILKKAVIAQNQCLQVWRGFGYKGSGNDTGRLKRLQTA